MNTPALINSMNALHPVIQQALSPFMPLTESERQVVDLEIARWQGDHHERNQAQALRLQIAEQTRNDLNWSML